MNPGVRATAEVRSLRRPLVWTLVVALCVAAATACVALATGSFDDTDWRVIGTSLGFAAFSSTAAAGAGAHLHAREAGRIVGLATAAVSAVAFVLLLALLWTDQGEGLLRAWACAAITALAGSHASLVLRARRHEDSGTIDLLVVVSLVTGGLDWALGFLPLAAIADTDVNESYGRALGVITVLLLLSTGLQPLLRRLERRRPEAGLAGRGFPHVETASTPRQRLAAEVVASADRIEAIAGGAEIARECTRLRELARSLTD
jgi:hypothetical protein